MEMSPLDECYRDAGGRLPGLLIIGSLTIGNANPVFTCHTRRLNLCRITRLWLVIVIGSVGSRERLNSASKLKRCGQVAAKFVGLAHDRPQREYDEN